MSTDERAQDDDRARARDVVLRKLAASPRSRAELERALAEKDVAPHVAAEVLDRYEELRLVDDQAYADVLVRSQHATKGLARRGLAHELRRRGVGDAEAAQALEQLDPASEREAARALVAKRLPATARLEPAVRLRRLTGLLARKGYDGATAMVVVREALAAEGAELDDDPPVLDD
ncbi:MAG: RecX [uncultured Quadrisphaera sp.]|uniref:Regulatory protein RecX n=1 Tax=uncultured Quadrisphaera sp. TaxID=904978 RepID=A0A6J4NP98_9ACTN|nr:MAG: RecX [uncultured Quadrisphaera sp.]